jgi:hypothetical protein
MTAFGWARKDAWNKGPAPRVGSMVMGTSSQMSLGRRMLAPAALGAAAAGFVAMALERWVYFDVGVLAFAGVVALGAVGLALRSVRAQVLARGVAWAVLAPSLLGLADSLWHGRLPDLPAAFFGATSAAALFLARPMLHTQAARTEFGPVGYRRVFLAGAVASAMTATASALFAFETFRWGSHGPALGMALLAAVLAGSALGVAKMRAWGVLLGAVGSVGALVAAVLSGNELAGTGLALAAIPGVLLASPLVAARLGLGAPRPATAPISAGRVFDEESPLVRARVATAGADAEEHVDAALEPAKMAARVDGRRSHA